MRRSEIVEDLACELYSLKTNDVATMRTKVWGKRPCRLLKKSKYSWTKPLEISRDGRHGYPWRPVMVAGPGRGHDPHVLMAGAARYGLD
jgi:hypothetical protein